MNRRLTDNDVEAAKKLLALFPEDELHTAIGAIGIHLDMPITYNELRAVFRRRNLAPLSAWCDGGEAWEVDLSGFDQGPALEWDDAVEAKPSGVERVALLPDAHVPSHDVKAFDLALRAIGRFKPDTLVILGDFADFASVSSHERPADKFEWLKDEVAAVNIELDRVDKIIGAKRVIYCGANHENRLARTIASKVPELYGLLTVEKLFKMAERNYEHVPYGSFAKVGRLCVTHDCGYTGASAAAKSRDAFGGNVAVGHCHNANISYRCSVKGEAHVGFSVGWLGDVEQIKYMHRVQVRNWTHGFGIAYVERDSGNCHVHFIPIVDGRCVVEGVIIQ